MELTNEMKEEMSFDELDKSYIPGQEKLPVVAYQLVKQIVRFFIAQHLEIKRLGKELRKLKGRVA